MAKGTAPGPAAPCAPRTVPDQVGGKARLLADPLLQVVVGIEVAKRRHVAGVLDAATGAVRQNGVGGEATADG